MIDMVLLNAATYDDFIILLGKSIIMSCLSFIGMSILYVGNAMVLAVNIIGVARSRKEDVIKPLPFFIAGISMAAASFFFGGFVFMIPCLIVTGMAARRYDMMIEHRDEMMGVVYSDSFRSLKYGLFKRYGFYKAAKIVTIVGLILSWTSFAMFLYLYSLGIH